MQLSHVIITSPEKNIIYKEKHLKYTYLKEFSWNNSKITKGDQGCRKAGDRRGEVKTPVLEDVTNPE